MHTLVNGLTNNSEASGGWEPIAIAADVAGRNRILDTTVDILNRSKETTTAFVPFTNGYHGERTMPDGVQVSIDSSTIAERGGETNIVPIVGAVSGVAGILIGIAISAAVWFYIIRKRMKRHAAEIPKNPKERTFERVDFNLTLPRNQSSGNLSSPERNSLPESGYRYFEEPIPSATTTHEEDTAEKRGAPVSFHYDHAELEDDEKCLGDGDFGYSPTAKRLFTPNDEKVKIDDMEYPIPSRTNFRFLAASLQKDLSDQSTISKRSSSETGAETRSSICTCRTDLPDSDESNCSTCGASLSVTSSLAREKPGGAAHRGRDLLIHDSRPGLSRVPSTQTTFSEATPSPNFQQFPVESDAHSPQHAELSSLSSSDLFLDGERDGGWHENEVEEDDTYDTSDPLKYFDLELPPSTFSIPAKNEPGNRHHGDDWEGAASHDADFKVSNSETINL